MDEFPTNAHTKRERPERVKEDEKDLDVKKPRVEKKIVANKVVRRKKTLGTRFREVFLGADADTVREYIIMDVMIPAAKDMITDAVSGGVERMLFGDSQHGGRRSRSRSRGPNVYTSYDRYSSRDRRDRPPFRDDRRDRPALSRRARENHDFDDIVLATRAEADEVIDRLYDLIREYDAASVSDLYRMLGETPAFTDDKWGWTDLRGSRVRHVRGGYLLDIPRPEPLD